jgi:membrane protease YdiL (CAAX protease family)
MMRNLTDWIKNHQIAAFFIITFAIMWALGFSFGAVIQKGQVLLAPLVSIAACGPALAGIIISAVVNTRTRQGTSKAVMRVFFIAWILSALVFIAHNTLIASFLLSPIIIGYSLIVVVPVAGVISASYARIPEVRNYVISLIRLRGVWGWSLFALVLFPGLIMLTIVISRLLGTQANANSQFSETGLTLIGLLAVKIIYQIFFFNAAGEEVGWRGFVMPRLQAVTSPLITSLIISIFWVPWHYFAWEAEGLPVLSVQFWIENFIINIPFGLIIVWICNRSKGSILVAGITHASANTFESFVPNFSVFIVIIFCLALVMILVDRMWKKLPRDHPAVYVPA